MSSQRVIAAAILCLAAGGCADVKHRREIEGIADCRRLAAPAAPPPAAPAAERPPSQPEGVLFAGRRLRLVEGTLDTSQLPPGGEVERHPLDLPLDLDDPRIQAYFARIKQRIEASWAYPREAVRQGQSGSGAVVFAVKQDGRLGDVSVVRSTGVDILDRYMVEAIRLAAPFPSIPCRVAGEVPVTLTFRYTLNTLK
jgi:TonB family protein